MLNLKTKQKLKKYLPWLIFIVAVIGFGVLAAHAQDITGAAQTQADKGKSITSPGWLMDTVINMVDIIVAGFIDAVGVLLSIVMTALITIAQYNNFANSTAVANGWVIVRDVCNMFFVLILLIIAIGTILKLDDFSAARLLKKFILMAILINFSRLICGLIIDASQVVMLTFVNGFKTIGAGNLATILGLPDIINGVTASQAPTQTLDGWAILVGFLLAMFYVTIALIVVVAMLLILVMRIVMLWIYIVLSPLAYLLGVLPGEPAKYSKMIWSEFTKNVIVGPVLAFFIWLSFVTLNTDINKEVTGTSGDSNTPNKIYNFANNTPQGNNAPQDANTAFLFKFVISIGMLMGGLIVTTKIGGVAGDIAKKAQGYAMGTLTNPLGITRRITDTGKAFNKQRAAKRSEKINQQANTLYRGYTAVTTAPVAALKTGIVGVRAGARAAGQAAAEYGEVQANRYLGVGVGNKIQNWRDNRQKKKEAQAARKEERQKETDHKQALLSAYNSGTYTDDKGNKYDYDRLRDRYLDKKGNIAKDSHGNEFGRMSDFNYRVKDSWNRGMAEYTGMKRTNQEKENKDQQKKFTDAGMSNDQLMAALNSTTANQTEKMAAAMTLAIKDGFKTKESMNKGKELVKGTAMEKEFKDNAIKKSAHLYYDLDKEKDKKDFARDKADGEFDVLNKDAYKDVRVLQTLADSMTPNEFVKEMDKVNNRSNDHHEALTTGMKAIATDFNKTHDASLNGTKDGAIDDKGKLNKILEASIRVTGDLHTATAGVTGKDDKEIGDQIRKIVNSGWKNSTVSDRAKMAEDSLPTSTDHAAYKGEFYKQFIDTDHEDADGKKGYLKKNSFDKFLQNRDLSSDTEAKLQQIFDDVNKIPAGTKPQPRRIQNTQKKTPTATTPSVTPPGITRRPPPPPATPPTSSFGTPPPPPPPANPSFA